MRADSISLPDIKWRGTRILLRVLPKSEYATQTSGGLYLPDQAQDRQKYRQWEIAAIGDQVRDASLQPGLRIITGGRFVAKTWQQDGEEWAVVLEENLAASFAGAEYYE